MNTPTTLAAYAAGLAAVFGAALGVGSAVGPVGAAEAPAHGAQHSASGQADRTAASPVADGLAVSRDGYTLLLEQAPTAPGRPAPLSFRVLGPDGTAVTEYEREHDKDLHLVLVRRDATGFQHLHPDRDAAGRWSTPVTLPSAGTWKVFADFTPAGADDGLTLATDVVVPGAVTAAALPSEERTAVVDGYTVRLTGDLVPGTSSPLTLSVSKDGRPVTDLQPYLGAYGHLVALREGDLAYLHVHPEEGGPGPEVAFAADVPSAADYRLFLDFQHEGVVRTAALGLRASAVAQGEQTQADEGAAQAPRPDPVPAGEGHDGSHGGHGG